MIPIQLKGHARPLTQLKFNKDGDLLFSAARDRTVCIWLSDTGERIGTLGPHGGSVMSVDVDKKTRVAVTATADRTVHFWDIKTGKQIYDHKFESTQRYVQLHPHGDQTKLLVVQDQNFGQKGMIHIFDLDLSNLDLPKVTKVREVECKGSPFVTAAWAYDGKHIIAGNQDGTVNRINAETGEYELSVKVHKESVTDIQMSPDLTYFLTTSRDSTACLMDVDGDFVTMRKTYQGDVPLNAGAISPIKDIIIFAGGIDARNVTTSSGTKFESHFFNKIFMDDLGRVGGHFGPINTIAIHPHGTAFASGSEDGYMRIHHFDKNYFDFEYTKLSN